MTNINVTRGLKPTATIQKSRYKYQKDEEFTKSKKQKKKV